MAENNAGRLFIPTKFRNGGRVSGSGISHDDYSEESGNKVYAKSVKVRFPLDGCSTKNLNGPVIIVQEGRKKDG